jgi:hypothetical protein
LRGALKKLWCLSIQLPPLSIQLPTIVLPRAPTVIRLTRREIPSTFTNQISMRASIA